MSLFDRLDAIINFFISLRVNFTKLIFKMHKITKDCDTALFQKKKCYNKFYVITFVPKAADHGRVDWLGYWDEFVQKARFKKLACLCHIKQNNLTYLGRVCTPCLSVSTGIYAKAMFLPQFLLTLLT